MQMTLDELKEAENLDLGTSESILVEQDRIGLFAEATEDQQWIHVDPERAASGPYGGTIAHGFLVLSLIPKLLFDMVRFSDAGMIVNLGIDKLRFLSPVPAGSEVCLRARLLSGTERQGGVMFRVRGDLLLAESSRRALVAELLFVAQPPDS